MLFPTCRAKGRLRISLLSLAACSCFPWFAAPAFGQPIAPPTPAVAGSETAKPDIDKAKATGTRPAEPPAVLQQLNSAIEQLTARISPAVVQVLVTGYGALEENNRGQTALITRENAIGSGVIVDADGYIMTNAHVVEGRSASMLHSPCLRWILPTDWRRWANSEWLRHGSSASTRRLILPCSRSIRLAYPHSRWAATGQYIKES